MVEKLNKETLERLYVKEDKSTYEIARMLGCSSETIANRCRAYGIKLKCKGKRKKKIDVEYLKKLYVSDGRTIKEITKILECSYTKVRESCLEHGIPLKTVYKKNHDFLKDSYHEEH